MKVIDPCELADVAPLKKLSALQSRYANLSRRESQVVRYLILGHAYKNIAANLNIAYGTVHVYIDRIYKKLHVQSRGQAVAKVMGYAV